MLRPATLADQPAPRIACELPPAPPPALAEPPSDVFLTAAWRNLIMLSWRVDPNVLESCVPRGVEIDAHCGATYISMVGFQFLDARLLGWAIPFHRDFEEVNLRFYVRRRVGREVRRGVVFIREICPRFAVSTVARLAYNEHYVTRPMRHRVTCQHSHTCPDRLPEGGEGQRFDVEYAWRHRRAWQRLTVGVHGAAHPPRPGSLEEFIVEHYWAYTRQRDGGSIEYRVAHPSWRVRSVESASLVGDLEPFYGRDLADVLRRPPDSAILADGSPVEVFRGVRIRS